MALLISSVYASEFEYKFNYFGNVMASKLDNSNYTQNHYFEDNIDNTVRISPHTRLGAQATIYDDNLLFMVQAVTSKNHDKYELYVPWLNAKYNITDDFAITAGRIQTPFFLNSETRHIDYLQLWTKPPEELYRIMSVRSYDGVRLSYDTEIFDDYALNVEAIPYGKRELTINTSKDKDLDGSMEDLHTLVASISSENTIFKATYTNTVIFTEKDATQLNTALAILKADGNDVSKYIITDIDTKMITLALKYDDEKIVAQVELARIDNESLYPSRTTGYVLFGYKFNRFTTYVIYSEEKDDKEHFDTSKIVTSNLVSAAVKIELDKLLYKTNTSQVTKSVGLNYTVDTGIVLKGQIDKTALSFYGDNHGDISNSTGTLAKDAGASLEDVYTYTISLSFAF